MARMAKISDQLVTDKSMQQEILALRATPPTLPDGDLVTEGFLMLPRTAQWNDFHLKLSNVLANSSTKFLLANKDVLDEFDLQQNKLMVLLLQSAKATLVHQFKEVAKAMCGICEDSIAIMDHAQAVKTITEMSASVNAKKLWSKIDLAKLVRAERCKQIEKVIKDFDERVASVLAAWPVMIACLSGMPTNIHDDLFKKLCKDHGQLDEFWINLDEHGTYLQQKIQAIVSAKVKDILTRDVESFVDFTIRLNGLERDAEAEDLMKGLSSPKLCGDYDTLEESALVLPQLRKDQQVICDEYLPYLPNNLAVALRGQEASCLKVAMAPLFLRLARLVAAVDSFTGDANKCIPYLRTVLHRSIVRLVAAGFVLRQRSSRQW